MREDEKNSATQANASSPPGERLSLSAEANAFSKDQSDASIGSQGDHDDVPLSPDMQQFIGRQLRAVYDDVAKQPVPDRFLELMKQLDTKTATR